MSNQLFKGEVLMLNQVVLVGRVTECRDMLYNDGKVYAIILKVPQSFKTNDKYLDSFIPVLIKSENIIDNTKKYVDKDDIIGVKGFIENLDGNANMVIADKITFLSSKK